MAAPFDKSAIIEFFLVEAGEHLQNLNNGLLALEKESGNRAIIDELFRAAFNKIKDGGEMEFEYRLDVGGKRKWFSTKLSPIIKDGKGRLSRSG